MAVTTVQKDPGPFPTTPVTITPPAYNPATDADSSTRGPVDRFVDQQWRNALKNQLGTEHPNAINHSAGYTS